MDFHEYFVLKSKIPKGILKSVGSLHFILVSFKTTGLQSQSLSDRENFYWYLSYTWKDIDIKELYFK